MVSVVIPLSSFWQWLSFLERANFRANKAEIKPNPNKDEHKHESPTTFLLFHFISALAFPTLCSF